MVKYDLLIPGDTLWLSGCPCLLHHSCSLAHFHLVAWRISRVYWRAGLGDWIQKPCYTSNEETVFFNRLFVTFLAVLFTSHKLLPDTVKSKLIQKNPQFCLPSHRYHSYWKHRLSNKPCGLLKVYYKEANIALQNLFTLMWWLMVRLQRTCLISPGSFIWLCFSG